MNITEKDNYFGFKFSVVMAIYNSENYLKEAIDSLINQSIGFENNIQLILVDDGSEDQSKDICLDYQSKYPNNILVLSQENAGQASARNNGLKYIQGKYVNFLDSDDYIDLDAFEKVYDFFEKHYDETDVVSIPVYFFERESGGHISNGKFERGSRIIDLTEEPNTLQFHTAAAFIKNECLHVFSFPTDVLFSEDVILVNKILLEKKTLGVLDSTKYHYRKRYDESSTIDTSKSKKEFYNERLTNYFLHLINYAKEKEGALPEFFHYMLVYDLQWVFEQADVSVLSGSEKGDFFKYLHEILDNIPSEAILNNRYIKNPFRRDYFLYMKENDLHIEITDKNDVLLKVNEYTIDNIYYHKIWFDIIEFDGNHLNISGLFNSLFDKKYISIEAVREKNNKIDSFIGKYAKYSSREDMKFLGDSFQFKYNFDIKIPIDENEESKIKIRVNFHKDGDNENFKEDNIVSKYIGLDFTPHVKLSKLSNYTFKNSNMLYFDNNCFYLIPYSFRDFVKLEWNCLKNIKKSKTLAYKDALKLRSFYLITYPILKIFKRNRQLYLFEDRITACDDNGEHLFKYAINEKDNVLKYFVLSKEAHGFERLSKIGNVLEYGSFKHKLMIFHTDKIISSHPYESMLNPFYDSKDDQRALYAGLIKYKIYFIQHGVTLGNLSLWLSKYDKNLSLISTVSTLENESYLDEGYNYDESILHVLGFPRYDNLKNNYNKQVLIIPTWRRYLKRDKDVFLNSTYYKNLNSLLNNRELIEKLKNAGYDIVFKPHPELTKESSDNERYLDLFDFPKEIKVSEEESYQELFNNSALMITDYSSVFFDFAYLKKPVIYYQKEQDYREKSYFDIETMGFGDIVLDEDELLSKVDFYLDNDCTMEDKFIERVDGFFKYRDQNNCKRVYDWIKEH